MKEKLENLKGKSRYNFSLAEFNVETGLEIETWNYISEESNTAGYKNVLYLEFNKDSIINAYLDCEKINTLPVFYIYFPLGTRWEDVLMDNFCIGIKSGNIQTALYCLETLSPLSCKSIFVSTRKPANLRAYKLIHSSYREQINLSSYKQRGNINKKVSKIKIVKEIVI